MAKLSDEELLKKYVYVMRPMWRTVKNSEEVKAAHESRISLRAEILKRMGKVDVAGIAREICESLAATKSNNGWMAKVTTILRSHLEGKSDQ